MERRSSHDARAIPTGRGVPVGKGAATGKGVDRTLLVAGLVGAAVIVLLLVLSLRLTENHLGYTLDDAYIHMAIAKNFSQHGVWGVTPYAFTSSSSGPLWTLLLSGIYLVTGPWEPAPLLLNLVCAVLVLWVAARLLRAWAGPGTERGRLIVLLAFLLCTPLAPLVFTGQEHTLHLLLTLLLAGAAARRLAGGEGGGGRWLWLWAPLAAATRYESLFLVLIVCLLLALRRRWREAIGLGLVALLPAVAYGMISLAQGWSWVPQPLLVKAKIPAATLGLLLKNVTGYVAIWRLFSNAHLLILVLGALAAGAFLAPRERGATPERPILALLVLGILLHLALADVGWFYRYEAYLVGLGVIVLGAAVLRAERDGREQRPGAPRGARRTWASVALALLLLVGLADRGVRAHLETPRATANIYEQQYQIGRFLRAYYPGERVALNDIGAANFLADLRCLDLMGLASREVARERQGGSYDIPTLEHLTAAHGSRIGVLCDRWFRIGARWRPLGQWRINHNIVNGDDTVSFYAFDPAATVDLLNNLRRFQGELPRTVLRRTAGEQPE